MCRKLSVLMERLSEVILFVTCSAIEMEPTMGAVGNQKGYSYDGRWCLNVHYCAVCMIEIK